MVDYYTHGNIRDLPCMNIYLYTKHMYKPIELQCRQHLLTCYIHIYTVFPRRQPGLNTMFVTATILCSTII